MALFYHYRGGVRGVVCDWCGGDGFVGCELRAEHIQTIGEMCTYLAWITNVFLPYSIYTRQPQRYYKKLYLFDE